jgi:AcrR family transcriptional regulator
MVEPQDHRERDGEDPGARERIYLATLACFERHGIRRTLMRDVAREAGVSQPAIYYYFSDKDGLIAEVVARQTAALYDQIRHDLELARPESLISAAMVHGIRIALADPYVSLLIKPDNAKLTARLAERGAVSSVRRSFWKPILRAARERGELRNDLDTDDVLRWLTGIEFMIVTEGGHLGMTDDAEIERYLRLFLLPALRPSLNS